MTLVARSHYQPARTAPRGGSVGGRSTHTHTHTHTPFSALVPSMSLPTPSQPNDTFTYQRCRHGGSVGDAPWRYAGCTRRQRRVRSKRRRRRCHKSHGPSDTSPTTTTTTNSSSGNTSNTSATATTDNDNSSRCSAGCSGRADRRGSGSGGCGCRGGCCGGLAANGLQHAVHSTRQCRQRSVVLLPRGGRRGAIHRHANTTTALQTMAVKPPWDDKTVTKTPPDVSATDKGPGVRQSGCGGGDTVVAGAMAEEEEQEGEKKITAPATSHCSTVFARSCARCCCGSLGRRSAEPLAVDCGRRHSPHRCKKHELTTVPAMHEPQRLSVRTRVTARSRVRLNAAPLTYMRWMMRMRVCRWLSECHVRSPLRTRTSER